MYAEQVSLVPTIDELAEILQWYQPHVPPQERGLPQLYEVPWVA